MLDDVGDENVARRSLSRVFGVEAWLCPHCDEPMVLSTVVIGPPATLGVIRGLGGTAQRLA